ncbi:MAG: hypothetical protein AAB414_02735 [Patescibacteria group bacterium]
MDLKNFFKKYWFYIFIAVLSIFVSWPTFLSGYFSHHDDLQVMRIFEMRKCFSDLQIPCRWVPDMGYGNGYPLFNYYNVFPYYIGALASYILGFVGSAKFLFFAAAYFAGFSMFLLAKEFMSLYPALLASILYIFAPYRALDIYVRGAVSESFAIVVIPLVIYFALKILKENSLKFILGLALSFAAFLTSHTIMTLIFAPLILVLFIIIFWGKKVVYIKSLIFSLGLGVGLSAFFIIPAFFEKDLVQIENLVRLDLDFRAHFVTIRQLLFERSWGYGASFPGPLDSISFQVGWPHWILAALSIITLLFKKNRRIFFIYFALLVFFAFSLFMTHNKSAFIWESIGMLRFVQFPWRFLSLSIFTSSLLAGFLFNTFKPSFVRVTFFALVLATVLLNWGYFKPEKFYPYLTDREKLSGELWEIQQKASIMDYLPKGAIEPNEKTGDKPLVVTGDAEIYYFKKTSNNFEAKISVKSPALIEFPVYDFPNWKVTEEGKEIDQRSDNYLGRVSIMLEGGNHKILGKFYDTPIRRAGNIISFVSILLVCYLIFYGKIRKNFK